MRRGGSPEGRSIRMRARAGLGLLDQHKTSGRICHFQLRQMTKGTKAKTSCLAQPESALSPGPQPLLHSAKCMLNVSPDSGQRKICNIDKAMAG